MFSDHGGLGNRFEQIRLKALARVRETETLAIVDYPVQNRPYGLPKLHSRTARATVAAMALSSCPAKDIRCSSEQITNCHCAAFAPNCQHSIEPDSRSEAN